MVRVFTKDAGRINTAEEGGESYFKSRIVSIYFS